MENAVPHEIVKNNGDLGEEPLNGHNSRNKQNGWTIRSLTERTRQMNSYKEPAWDQSILGFGKIVHMHDAAPTQEQPEQERGQTYKQCPNPHVDQSTKGRKLIDSRGTNTTSDQTLTE